MGKRRKEAPPPPPRWRWAPVLLVLAAGMAAYCNSFRGPFILDDLISIRGNPQIRAGHTGDFWAPNTLSGRPVLEWTFALNYSVGGLRVEGYHAANLLIHLGSGLLLYGIVSRNLSRREFWGDRFARSGPWLAGFAAAVWVAHPLTTQSVTYIVQRAESLTSLFYLAVIYCLIRHAEKPANPIWPVVAFAASALGMASKEMFVTAPVVALLYDRTFLGGSFWEALRRRWKLYAALAVTSGILYGLVAMGMRSLSAGFSLGISPLEYAMTQLGIIAHYIVLAVWPTHLALDYYDWPVVRSWRGIGWPGFLVLLLMLGTVWAFWKKPWLGFLGAWFFVILSPSSSIVPIVTEIAAEQRMYLPLAAWVTLIVVGGWTLLGGGKEGRAIISVAGVVVLGALVGLTLRRNAEYRSPLVIWGDNIAERPNDPRAHFQEGLALIDLHQPAAAAAQFQRTIELEPRSYAAAAELGACLKDAGDLQGAEHYYDIEIPKLPASVSGVEYFQRGWLRAHRGDWEEAKEDFLAAEATSPHDPQIHYFLGIALQHLGDISGAEAEFQYVLQLPPFGNTKDAEDRLRQLRGGGG